MNCPKCGSKNIRMEDKFDEFTVYHCNKCNDYFATYEWAIKVDRPSTAEKLLWLDDSGIEVTIEDRKKWTEGRLFCRQ